MSTRHIDCICIAFSLVARCFHSSCLNLAALFLSFHVQRLHSFYTFTTGVPIFLSIHHRLCLLFSTSHPSYCYRLSMALFMCAQKVLLGFIPSTFLSLLIHVYTLIVDCIMTYLFLLSNNQ
eukprot:m.298926 g.298926  ORF g.298926 m.298926 type:complete len:121 (+) comp40785_c1_seq53:1267-1629(+)